MESRLDESVRIKDLRMSPPPLPAKPGQPRVLVVDDEEDIRDVLRMTLTELSNCQVTTASDGRSALERMRKEPFDLVITDLRMPEMDGSRLLDITRYEFPDIPVVLITGYASMETAIEALQLGAANFITKPFRVVEVKEVVEKAIQRKRDREIPRRVLPCLLRERLVFQIPPTFESKSGAIHYLTEKLVGVGVCDESGRYFVSISLDEALTNAMFYGCLDIPPGLRETETGTEVFNRLVAERMEDETYLKKAIGIEMVLTPEQVEYRISDPGQGFDVPDLKNNPPEPTSLSRLHGRGILLISCFMDDVWFNSKGNQITLVKKKGGKPDPSKPAAG